MRVVETFTQEPYRFLSNMHECPVELSGYTFKSVEHGYQALKAVSVEEFQYVADSPTPKISKRRGREVECHHDWNNLKQEIMYLLVKAKFTQNPELGSKLLELVGYQIYEGNYWHDRYWGVSPIGSTNGSNHLGKIIMRVRDELYMSMFLVE